MKIHYAVILNGAVKQTGRCSYEDAALMIDAWPGSAVQVSDKPFGNPDNAKSINADGSIEWKTAADIEQGKAARLVVKRLGNIHRRGIRLAAINAYVDDNVSSVDDIKRMLKKTIKRVPT